MEERIIMALREHGFTASDAKAYVALLKAHPATGYELAARSGVPRSAIYNVLRRLEGQGLVNAIDDKPTRYVPLSPERLVDLLETRFERSLGELQSSLDKLAPRAVDVVTWTVQGYEAMLERAESLVSRSKKSIYGSIWRREADALARPLERARENGVEVVLFSFNPLSDSLGRILSYGIPAPELEKYWSHKIILVGDEERVLVGGAERTQENRAVITEEASLVEMAVSNLVLDITLLGQRTGVDTGEVVAQLTRMLAPVEDLFATVGGEAGE